MRLNQNAWMQLFPIRVKYNNRRQPYPHARQQVRWAEQRSHFALGSGYQGVRNARRKLIERQYFVERRVGHMRETSAVCIACQQLSDHMPEERFTNQSQIPDQIQHFMAAALVLEA